MPPVNHHWGFADFTADSRWYQWAAMSSLRDIQTDVFNLRLYKIAPHVHAVHEQPLTVTSELGKAITSEFQLDVAKNV